MNEKNKSIDNILFEKNLDNLTAYAMLELSKSEILTAYECKNYKLLNYWIDMYHMYRGWLKY